MSISWLVFRADQSYGPINTWESDHSAGIAPAGEIQLRLSRLLPELVWDTGSVDYAGKSYVYHSTLSELNKRTHEPYIDLWFREEEDGFVHVISTRRLLRRS